MKIAPFGCKSKFTTLITILFCLLQVCSSTILAIDYGTGFSKNSIIGPRTPLDIVLSQDSKRKDVSGIMIRPHSKNDIERSYGSNLLNFQLRFPHYVNLGLKRLLNDFSVFQKINPGVVVEDNEILIKGKDIDLKYSCQELIAMHFNHIIHNANQQFTNDNNKVAISGVNLDIDDLVLSVPRYYDQSQRLKLDDIIEISDFKQNLGFVDDNIATGISYIAKNHVKLDNDTEDHFIVYDLGQGSLKVSLLTTFKNSTAVLNKDEIVNLNLELNGYGYDSELGGDVFTLEIRDLIINKFLDKNSKYKKNSLLSNAKFLNKLTQTAEKCKLVLSANNEYKIFIESLIDDVDFKGSVTRQEFEMLIMNKYAEDLIKPLDDALKSVNQFNRTDISLANISSIILTGGSTRVPYVQQVLVDYLGDYYTLLSKSVNSDESVSSGLAIRGVKLENTFKFKQNINIIDKAINNYTAVLVNENVELPVFQYGEKTNDIKKINVTLDEGQKGLLVNLHENDQELKQYNIKFKNLKKCKDINANSTLELSFKIDKSGIFNIDKAYMICNQTSERIYDVSIEKYFIEAPKTTAELKKSQKVIKQLNEKDEQKVIIAEAINLFESKLYETRSILGDYETNTELPRDILEELEFKINEYLEWLDYESDGCSLTDIEKKHIDVNEKINHIKNYELSLKTPLDLSEFNAMFENLSTWFEEQDEINKKQLETIDEKSKKFNSLNITGTAIDTFLTTPLTTRLLAQNATYYKLIDEVNEIFLPKLLNLLKDFESSDRIEKFNIKLEYMDLVQIIEEMNTFVTDLYKYRIRYLDTIIVKRERQLLREYEKAKMEKVRELGLKDKDGNSVEEMMEKAHKRAEQREKNEEEEFMKNTDGYEKEVEEEIELDEL